MQTDMKNQQHILLSGMAGLTAENECAGCTTGFYCPTPGLTVPPANCSARYYCSGNATVATPTDGVTGNVCPVGHYYPAGSGQPVPCGDGTFTDTTLNEVCLPCTEGSYCVNGLQPQSCPAGFYFPAGKQ